ncbi:hypothetical protein C0585_05845 [Candidatus Woesearchaeota archaeon]|nr:MAG: hypothetical protein C0585_05845 [Candidatus Woesearchaeota archaeon]
MELNTKILKGLKPKIEKALKLIDEAAKSKQVIFVRHHNDCDGYSAALALDRLIYKKISENHFKERDTHYFYRRTPSQTPYYSFEDSTRDIAFIYDSIVTRNKNPLMIILDNGSSKQDLEGIKRLKAFGFKIIVIDHHPPTNEVDDLVDVHVNPYQVDDKAVISAGTLCSYIAGCIDNDDETYNVISAVSGISDRMEGEEFKLSLDSLKDKYSYEQLKDLGRVVDYELQRSGYLDPWTMVKELLLNELGKRKILLNQYLIDLNEKDEESLQTSLKYATLKEKDNLLIARIDLFQTNHKGSYPSSGKTTGILHRYLEENNVGKEVITFGINPEMITLRGTDNAPIDTNMLIRELKTKFPQAKIEGGGHPHAGSIKFIQAAKNDILDFIDSKY